MTLLASASDLRGQDQGSGNVRLSWEYPGDIAVLGIVFDVFGSADPQDVFRTRFAQDVAATAVALEGLGLSGDRYFTVVARRGDLLSLPARILRLAVQPPVAAASPPAGGSDAALASGVGFPFGISSRGGVYAQGGDLLLRGKILQLLLTSPGERVNRPDYGTRLLDLVFDPNSDVLAATTQFMVARALQKYLSDEIQIDKVLITADDAMLNVDISYIKKADLRSELVRVGVPLPGGAGA
ncbi:MAG TPA: GPW/gp25 family protein [Polyangiaceae bacterium]|nr:GPW/gp25 family protein [Polyangiaceae bacterium]